MSKKAKLFMVTALVAVLLAGGFFLYYKSVAPPGEEWISYDNDPVIADIDRQLDGLDMEAILKEKEKYVKEKRISDIQEAVRGGKISYEELTAICLYRIKTLDQCERGYNSVITVNPKALEEAKAKDQGSKTGGASTPIFGIPVMLKDNINTADMPTSAGAAALADFRPGEDAGLVRNLKKQGAIILGKNNLSEFANYVSSMMPAGYSGRKGQTINPFGPLKISASGSSSGSAVSVTANLVPLSIGTETDGSIIAPAAANSTVGFKPTRGSVPGDGIVPLIKQIDTAGPITKTVQDAAVAYRAISGKKLTLDLKKDAMKGKTIGLAGYEYNDKTMLEKLRQELERMGASVADVSIDETGVIIFGNIKQSFKKEFEEFAVRYNGPVKKLSDLLAFNEADKKRRMKYGQDLLEEANEIKGADLTQAETSMVNADSVLQTLFEEKHLDGIVFLNSSASTLPAAAGYPELTIPFGKDDKGVPQGATFVTPFGEDERLMNLGYCFEASTQDRLTPEEK